MNIAVYLQQPSPRNRPRTQWAYASVALPTAMLGVIFYTFLPRLYSEQFGLSLVSIGAVVLFSRVWDAVIDPAVGVLSDRYRSRFGRRRPFIALSVLPLAATMVLLAKPEMITSTERFSITVLFGVLSFLFFLFFTTLTIPYEAWGAELEDDPHHRTSLFARRDGALVLGTLLAGALPAALSSQGFALSAAVLITTAIGSLLLVCAAAWCLGSLREPAVDMPLDAVHAGMGGMREVLNNRPFRTLLIAYVLGGFGAALPATLIIFFTEEVLGSSRGPLVLFLYLCTGFLFIPLWVALSRRFGKKRAWLAALLLQTGAFIPVLALGKGDEMWYLILSMISGIGYGGTMVIPSSLQADVIAADVQSSGIRREAQFIGLWSIGKKLAAALGAGVAFPVLAACGYVRGGAASQESLVALSILYAGVPSLCNLLSFLVARRFELPALCFSGAERSGDRN